jgi:hypothetical protein
MWGKGATKWWGVGGIFVVELKKNKQQGRWVGDGDGFFWNFLGGIDR